METVNLPAVLPGHLDLVALNQQLRDRQAQLDWSLFEKATDQDLAILLAGLDMAQDEQVLGVDTMSEKIGDRLLTFFENNRQGIKEDYGKILERVTGKMPIPRFIFNCNQLLSFFVIVKRLKGKSGSNRANNTISIIRILIR